MNKKVIFLTLIGNVIISLGVCVLRLSGFGIDPFSAMNLGVSTCLGVGLGLYQSIFNIVLLLPVIFLKRESLGIGSIINMFLFGYFVQGFSYLLSTVGLVDGCFANIALRVVLLLTGLLICNFGAALYMACESGVGPYDAIAPIITDKTKIPFKFTRIFTDLTCAVIGFVSGQIAGITTIGLATIFFVVGCGPLVSFFREKLFDPYIEKCKA